MPRDSRAAQFLFPPRATAPPPPFRPQFPAVPGKLLTTARAGRRAAEFIRPRQLRRLPIGVPRPLQRTTGLSDSDRALIRLLQTDGRMPYTSLARQLGLSEKTVRRRVSELLSDGVIEITTVSDPAALGYDAVGLLAIDTDGTRSLRSLAQALAELDAVDYVVITSGRYHLLAEVLCPDMDQFLSFIDTSVRTMDGIAHWEHMPYLSLHYQQPQWEAAARPPDDGAPPISKIDLDEIDKNIVRELNADGRAPYQQIATRLGVSEGLVRQHVSRLRRRGAVRVMALVNPYSLGFRTMAWLGITVHSGAKVADLADRITRCPAITYLAICAGRFDVLAEVVCAGPGELSTLIDQEIRPVKELATVETFLCLDLYYRGLRPSS
jgi:DNA-binding Lrp family transcriptional regulator